MKSHLLLRGEQPEILTGYNLISEMYGNVVYVPRSIYADRDAMLAKHANHVAGHNGSIMWFDDKVSMASIPNGDHATGKVAVVKEGGGDAVALLGHFSVFLPTRLKFAGFVLNVSSPYLSVSRCCFSDFFNLYTFPLS